MKEPGLLAIFLNRKNVIRQVSQADKTTEVDDEEVDKVECSPATCILHVFQPLNIKLESEKDKCRID